MAGCTNLREKALKIWVVYSSLGGYVFTRLDNKTKMDRWTIKQTKLRGVRDRGVLKMSFCGILTKTVVIRALINLKN